MPLRRIWTEFQDKTLKYLRQDLNIQRWSLIAEKLQNDFGILGRNQKQCRQRYHNHLDSSLKLGKLSENEEKLLLNLHNKLGNKWAEIASFFQGRTDSSLKNIYHSKLRKGIRKFNRTAKDKLKQNAKIYPLNFFSKIMEQCEFAFYQQTDKKELDFDFLKQLQNRLIKYAENIDNESQLDGISDNKVFQDLNDMLSKIQQFQKFDGEIEKDQESDSSEYFPLGKKRIQENIISMTKSDQDGNKQIFFFQKRNSSKVCNKIKELILQKVLDDHQKKILVRKQSLQTLTALSQHFEEKFQSQFQELSFISCDENLSLDFKIQRFDDAFYENFPYNDQKNDETEISFRQISESQCSLSQELFNLMMDNQFNDSALF